MEIKEKILQKSEELFLRYGLKSVTMDDLARQLGVSKKTLYQFVENKADLVEKIILMHIAAEKALMEEVRAKSGDAVEEMIQIARYAIQQLRKLSPTLVYDLQKYYQNAWQLIQNLRSVHVHSLIRDNIERGIEQGVYRSDLDAAIIAKIYVLGTLAIVDENAFPQKEYNKETLFIEFIKYHLQGITTEKGLELYKKHLNKEL